MADDQMVAAPPAVVNNGGENAEQNQNQFQLFPFLKSMATRMIMFYIISMLIRNFFGGNQNQTTTNQSSSGPVKTYPPSMNMFGPGQIFDTYMYLSPKSERFRDFDNADAFLWSERGLIYNDWNSGENEDGSRMKSVSFPTPDTLKNNGSLYLHVFIVKSGQSPVTRDNNYAGREIVYGSMQLNKYKKKHYKKTANLLTGKTDQSEHDQKKAEEVKYEVLNYWHPNITVNLVNDFTAWTRGQLPSPLDEAVKFDVATNRYYPILFFNTYWNLGTEYQPINETVSTVNLTVTFAPLSLFKWQLYASQQMRGKWSQMLGGELFEQDGDDDQDAIKQALLETNPILLGITIVVSILHTVLEFLAFKNDIQFWRTRKSLEGLSVRSVLFNIFQSAIVFLYICDNDSSWVIKISIGFGLLIELWKIPKCLNVEISRDEKILGILPKIKFSDKGTYVESETKVYDQLAFKYLSWALFPLLGCYAVYSLMYEEQRGWYSWMLSMLYGFLLTFGFIMMTPQLFINYKLKSVAHLPWRMLTYKFINTFIDDLFAFVIRMPTLYRLGCFRDDIIFLIYIYQRWIYRVDPKRVNEYGVSMDDPTGAKAIENQSESTEENNQLEIESANSNCEIETKKDK
ncbi:cleft lip and palate transmembrane protein 1 (CLPTM1) domain-containing protein [Ditylenchus destructor]|uniref:Cleft lip and palate transmembrane protein 1 (CLPTM1) domain-containing protein n=1 Tax=Ditylenchus destructor TaxID=166010 RepID=A0AAD4RC38_9BILA|nr:cleft lip and palate transmembrane protein 1 (CLPTM1) domain-containing protein [Ditylenchus destructor]